MQQAQEAMKKNDADTASRKQQEAAKALEKLSNQLPQRQKAPAQAKNDDNGQKQTLPSKEQAEKARQLAKEQRDLQAEAQKPAAQARAGRKADNNSRDNPAGKLAKEQADVAKEAQKL